MPLTSEGPVTHRSIGAVLFLGSANITFQAFGTLNSSPWTITNVGADPEKVASMRQHVAQAVGASMGAAILSAYIAESWWPVIAAGIANAYLVWVYERAAREGAKTGSTGEGWFDTWGQERPRPRGWT